MAAGLKPDLYFPENNLSRSHMKIGRIFCCFLWNGEKHVRNIQGVWVIGYLTEVVMRNGALRWLWGFHFPLAMGRTTCHCKWHWAFLKVKKWGGGDRKMSSHSTRSVEVSSNFHPPNWRGRRLVLSQQSVVMVVVVILTSMKDWKIQLPNLHSTLLITEGTCVCFPHTLRVVPLVPRALDHNLLFSTVRIFKAGFEISRTATFDPNSSFSECWQEVQSKYLLSLSNKKAQRSIISVLIDIMCWETGCLLLSVCLFYTHLHAWGGGLI